jgi:hypothetical protein
MTKPEMTRTERRINVRPAIVAILLCCAGMFACRDSSPPTRRQLDSSGWIEEAAAQRGYIKAGDVAEFGCPPGWAGVDDTIAALRGPQASAVYVGSDPQPREGTVTCVAQAEFALPRGTAPAASAQQPPRRPASPVWVDAGPDSITVGFRSEVSARAAIYIARDTPCGPRVIGVRLGDLLTWLVDPQAATKRDFLGMVSAGCPEKDAAR